MDLITLGHALTVALALGTTALAQDTGTLESIGTPDQVETSIGSLNFMDGAPSPETVQKVYDYLDTMRGVDDFFLKEMPGVSLYGIVDGARKIGAAKAHQIIIMHGSLSG